MVNEGFHEGAQEFDESKDITGLDLLRRPAKYTPTGIKRRVWKKFFESYLEKKLLCGSFSIRDSRPLPSGLAYQ